MTNNLPAATDSAQLDLIKRTVAKGATTDELALFLHTAKRTGLDPLAKQIHFITRRKFNKDKNCWEENSTIQTGIDGFRLIADRTGRYAPGDIVIAGNIPDMTATASIKKLVDGTWHEIKASAYYTEYVQATRDGQPMGLWAKMPRLMLGKCAEALALRRAFPAELSGVYTHDEMGQAASEQAEPKEGNLTSQKETEAIWSEIKSGTAPEPGPEKPPDVAALRKQIVLAFANLCKGEGVTTPEHVEKLRHLWVETFYGVSGLAELNGHDLERLALALAGGHKLSAQKIERIRSWIQNQKILVTL